MYKQIIIARKDLNMSAGKLASQVCHASMAFLTSAIKENYYEVLDCKRGFAWERGSYYFSHAEKHETMYRRPDLNQWASEARERGDDYFFYEPVDKNNPYGELRLCEKKFHVGSSLAFDVEMFNQWFLGSFTKIILEAKNKKQLEKSIIIANDLGFVEGKDYFLIKDNCMTELEPEEVDENGVERTLTCIGFAPMKDVVINKIAKKYQLWRD